MSKKTAIIESQYWGSIDYFRLLKRYEKVGIEQHEHFVKATYRNRCHIATPDGMLALSIPIIGGRNVRKSVKEIELFNRLEWQKKHWQSLCSAYRRSPFFEYFEDELEVFYQKEYQYLYDFNQALFSWLLEQLNLEINWYPTAQYQKELAEDCDDLRTVLHPKASKNQNPLEDSPIKYHQVFEDRCGFMPNLSILDLLFAEGPNAPNLLA